MTELTLADAGIPSQGAVRIEDLKFVKGHIRCLVWGKCHVRNGDSEWDTGWKWMVGSWSYWLGTRLNDGPHDPSTWFIPSIHDAPRCQITKVQITHVCALPEDPTS